MWRFLYSCLRIERVRTHLPWLCSCSVWVASKYRVRDGRVWKYWGSKLYYGEIICQVWQTFLSILLCTVFIAICLSDPTTHNHPPTHPSSPLHSSHPSIVNHVQLSTLSLVPFLSPFSIYWISLEIYRVVFVVTGSLSIASTFRRTRPVLQSSNSLLILIFPSHWMTTDRRPD